MFSGESSKVHSLREKIKCIFVKSSVGDRHFWSKSFCQKSESLEYSQGFVLKTKIKVTIVDDKIVETKSVKVISLCYCLMIKVSLVLIKNP